MSRRRKQYQDQGGETTAQPGGETTALPAVPDTSHPHYTPWPCIGYVPSIRCPSCKTNDVRCCDPQPSAIVSRLSRQYKVGKVEALVMALRECGVDAKGVRERHYYECKRCAHHFSVRADPKDPPAEMS